MHKIRVRYAPSPTGLLHIGNARTALFNYLFARKHQGDFIIRIEDTDINRNVEGGEISQLENLAWLGINWDESVDKGGPYGPYRQLERLDIYKKYSDDLLKRGLAYYDEGAIRFKVPSNVVYQFDDLVRGSLNFNSEEIEDWVIIKENGIPTYNFAVVVDDHLMEITHVFRGEEHITNTPKQIMVYQSFGWELPQFAHMSLIVNEERKKLSKRDTDVIQFIGEYREMGFLPEALFNFISLLGWSPTGNEEILSQEQLIEQFDASRLNKAPAMFDKVKLAYINGQYIKKLSIDELKELTEPHLNKAGIEVKDKEWLETLLNLFQDRLLYGAHIVELYFNFFNDEVDLSNELIETLKTFDQTTLLLETLKDKLIKMESFNAAAIDALIKQVGKDLDIKGKALFMPTRIATTFELHGPSLPHSLYLLGIDKIVKRIDYTLNQIKGVL